MGDTVWQCKLCEATSAGTAVRRARSDRSLCSWCEAELARKEQRRCRKCSSVAPIASFGTKHKGRWCGPCDSAAIRAQYERDRAARLEYQRARYWDNPEAARARHYEYLARNREKINMRRRARRAANPEPSRATVRRAYWRDPAKVRARADAWRRNHSARRAEYLRMYRARRKLAILRGIR